MQTGEGGGLQTDGQTDYQFTHCIHILPALTLISSTNLMKAFEDLVQRENSFPWNRNPLLSILRILTFARVVQQLMLRKGGEFTKEHCGIGIELTSTSKNDTEVFKKLVIPPSRT